FPWSRRIQSVTAQAMTMAGSDPSAIVDKLGPYQGLITDVLFDVSGGQGIKLDAEQLLPYLRAVEAAYPSLRLGVAGGLGPDKMQPIRLLLDSIWPLNWDAQSQLYCHHQQELDPSRVNAYLYQSYC